VGGKTRETGKLMGGSLLDSLVEDDRVVSAIKEKDFITNKDWEGIMDLYTEEHNEFSDTDLKKRSRGG
jgi:hypothetical protein